MSQDKNKEFLSTESLFKDIRKTMATDSKMEIPPKGISENKSKEVAQTSGLFADLKVLTIESESSKFKYELIGKQIGSNLVESIIGEGGFSIVYKVRDTNLGVYRALKLFKLNPLDPASKDDFSRLQKEARIATYLHHQYICKVHSFDYYPYPQDGNLRIPYMVMDYVEGESLRGLIKERTQPFPEVFVLSVFIQCLEALNYAFHTTVSFVDTEEEIAVERQYCNITHRDLKPENILLNRNNAIVIDFGIAKTFDNAQSGATLKGFYMGTTPYVAPEIIRGVQLAPEKAFKGDLYGLCVVLYELIEGKLPFYAENKSDLILLVGRQIYSKPKCNPWTARLIQKGLAQKYSSYDEALHDAAEALSRYNVMSTSQVVRRFFEAREKGIELEEAFREFNLAAQRKAAMSRKNFWRRVIVYALTVGVFAAVIGFLVNKGHAPSSSTGPVVYAKILEEQRPPAISTTAMPSVPAREERAKRERPSKARQSVAQPAKSIDQGRLLTKEMYDRAGADFTAGDLDNALEILQAINDPAADYRRGLIYMKKEDYFSALRCFERIAGPSALETFSVKDFAYYQSALCYGNLYFQRKRDKYRDEALARFMDLKKNYQGKIPQPLYERIDARIQSLSSVDN